MSFSNDSATRIQAQTFENLKQRYENQYKEKLEAVTQNLKEARLVERAKEAEEVEGLFEDILGKLDVLIEFVVTRHGELPEELIELVAARQEQRIEKTLPQPIDLADSDVKADVLPLANVGAVAGSVIGRAAPLMNGQVMKVQNGTVGWTDAETGAFRTRSLQTVREEVRQLLAHLRK